MSIFEEFLAQYQGHSASTQRVYREWLERFAEYCRQRGVRPLDCQRGQVEAYFQELTWSSGRNGLYTANTLYIAKRTVSRFFYWAIKNGHLGQHPYPDLMPRPPQPEKTVLSPELALRLLNLPDVSKPLGLRDLLLLEAVFELGWSFLDCTTRGLEWDDALEPIGSTWRRYCEKGRPYLARPETTTLLVTRAGRQFTTLGGARHILDRYGRALKLPFKLTNRILHRSHLDLVDKGARRRWVLNP